MYREILDANLTFIGVKDFCLRKDFIKTHYQTIDDKQIIIFKWYIYQQPFLCEGDKDMMWGFLNDDVDEGKLLEKFKRYLK